jgi:hypothetical protein
MSSTVPTSAGYSGTPLAKKLGITAGCRVVALSPPGDLMMLLEPLPEGVEVANALPTPRSSADRRTGPAVDVVLFFTTSRAELEAHRAALGQAVFPSGSIWVCWPKKASKVATDVTEDVVREVVLPHGLVDVKVCAVSDIWSGLKVMWRKDRRE